jgi:hypothetical protein
VGAARGQLEEKMKKITFAILLATAVITSVAMAQNKNVAAHCNEKAVVEFPQLVLLNGAFLKGSYLVIHDDALMARGENCTYIYEYTNKEQGRLVMSFHCTPVERDRVGNFTVQLAPDTDGPSGIRKVIEIQFAGSAEGHQLPAE